jgi:DivIVA domain-containing protein
MQTMLPDHVTRPDFAVAVRGYDRAQVDDYVGRVLEWLADAERRTVEAEDARHMLQRQVADLRATLATLEERAGIPGPQSLHAFSEKMAEVMQAAVAAAEELRLQAEREAADRRDAIAAEAQHIVEQANAEAHEIVRRAHRKERAIERNIVDLGTKRAAALSELGRLQRQLGELLALTPDALTPDALAPDALTPDALAPDALAPDALAPPGGRFPAPELAPSGTASGGPALPRPADALDPVDTGDVTAVVEVVSVEGPGLPGADTGEVLVTPEPTRVSPAPGRQSPSRRPSGGSARRA